MGLTGVNLGAAYAQVLVDYSQMERDANQAFQRIEQGLTDKLNNIGRKMMLVGQNIDLLTSPIQNFVQQGIFAFANFDEVMTEIAARTGATADEMERVKAVSLEMGKNTQFSATEASQAMLEMLSSGSSLEEAISALPDVLNLAAVGTIGLGQSADSVTDILAQFQKDISHSGEVVDALSAASQKSSATIPDLIAAFSNVGPIANAFGLSIEDTAAVLAVFAESGIKGAEAGTQLKSMLNNMARDTDEVQAAWAELGTSLFDAEGNMRNIDDVIDDINAALTDKTPEERQRLISDLAGTYGQMGLEALLAADGIDQMQDSMDEAADSSDLAAQKMNSWKGIVNQVKSSIETLSITTIGPLVEDYLKPLAKELIGVINVINDWMVDNPELAKQIGVLLGVLSLLGPVIFTIGTAIVFMTTPMGAAAVSAGVMSLGIIGIVLALGALWIAYKQNFMGFADGVDKAFAELKPTLEAVVGWFNNLVDAFQSGGLQGALDFIVGEFDRLKNVLSSIDFQGLAGQGAGLLGGLWEMFKPRASEAIDMAQTWVNEHIIQPVVDYVSNIDWMALGTSAASTTLNFLGGLWDWLKPRGQAALKFAGDWLGENVVQPVVDYVKAIDWVQLATNAGNATLDFLSSLWDWLKPYGQAGIDFASAWVNEHIIQPVVDYVSNIDWMALGNQSIDFLSSLLEWLGNQAMAGGNIAVNWLNAHVLQPIVDYVSNIDWGALAGQGIDFIGGLLAWLGGQASAGGEAAAGQASSAGNKAADWVQSNIIQPVIDYINNIDWSSLANQGIDFVGGLLDWLGAQAVAGGNIAIDWAKEHIIQPILDALNITPEDIEGAGNFLSALFDSIAAGVVDAAAWIDTNIITRITDAMPDINLGTMGDFLIAIFGAIGDCAMDVAAWIKDFIVTPLNEQLNEVDWDEIGCFIGDIFDAIAAEAPDIAQWILDNIINPLGDALATADWSQIADDLGTFFSNLWAEIKENAPKVADWVWENIGVPVKDAVADIDWSQVADDLAGFGKDLYAALGEAVDFASEAASWVNDNILSPIGNAISDAGDFLGIGGDGGDGEQPAWVQSLQDGFGEGEDAAPLALATEEQIDELNDLKTWFEENSGKVIEKLDAMKAAAQFMIETLTELTIGGVDKLNIWRDGFQDILPGIMSFRDVFTETILSAIEPVNLLSDAVRILSQRLYDLSLHNTITVSVSGSVDVPTPARAEGGRIDANVMFLGAEQQRGELFVSDRSGMVVNNDQLQTAINALSQGGGGRTVNVYIDGDTIKDEAAARRNGDIFGQQILEVLRST